MKLKAILIEDEYNVRQGFLKLLDRYCNDVEVIGQAESVEDGLSLINKSDIDILFLDINLPDGTGFDLINQVEEVNFHIIFVTAYNQYAVDAFKLSAVDYLLKPISPDLLIKAIEKVKKIDPIRSNPQKSQISNLQTFMSKPNNPDNKIIVRYQGGLQLLPIKDIVYCCAEGSYTFFKLADGTKYLASVYLKEYGKLLEPYDFARCHHSYLINLRQVKEIKKSDGGSCVMNDGTSVPISSRKRNFIIEKLGKLFIG